jgi:hypothetical protein
MYFNTKNNKGILLEVGATSSCRGEFNKLDIPAVPSLYSFAMIMLY